MPASVGTDAKAARLVAGLRNRNGINITSPAATLAALSPTSELPFSSRENAERFIEKLRIEELEAGGAELTVS